MQRSAGHHPTDAQRRRVREQGPRQRWPLRCESDRCRCLTSRGRDHRGCSASTTSWRARVPRGLLMVSTPRVLVSGRVDLVGDDPVANVHRGERRHHRVGREPLDLAEREVVGRRYSVELAGWHHVAHQAVVGVVADIEPGPQERPDRMRRPRWARRRSARCTSAPSRGGSDGRARTARAARGAAHRRVDGSVDQARVGAQSHAVADPVSAVGEGVGDQFEVRRLAGVDRDVEQRDHGRTRAPRRAATAGTRSRRRRDRTPPPCRPRPAAGRRGGRSRPMRCSVRIAHKIAFTVIVTAADGNVGFAAAEPRCHRLDDASIASPCCWCSSGAKRTSA